VQQLLSVRRAPEHRALFLGLDDGRSRWNADQNCHKSVHDRSDLLVCNQDVAGSTAKQGAASSSREDRSKPLGDGFLEMTQLPLIENGHQTVGDIQVAVVMNFGNATLSPTGSEKTVSKTKLSPRPISVFLKRR